MKLFVVTTALAAAMSLSSAWAQEKSPPAPTPEANATTGSLTIQGIPPSKVLGAIDTSKLVDQPPPADDNNLTAKVQAEQSAQAQAPLAKSADAKGVTTKPDPNDKTHSDAASASTGAVGVQTASLPAEVEAAISDGKYSTRDLVQAQLEAVRRMPPVMPTTTTIVTTTPPSPDAAPTEDRGSPVFDGATRPGDWSQSAGTVAPPG
jgi:hypothetical protein